MKTDRAVQALIRKKITDANVVEAMLATLRGEPLPTRAPTGEITGYGDVPTIELRMAVADKLLGRISPTLRATDLQADGGSGVVINVVASMPLPGSQARAIAPPTATDEPIDTTAATPAPAEAQPFQRRRRR